MARISTYTNDDQITGDERVIGTNPDGTTTNILVSSLQEFILQDEVYEGIIPQDRYVIVGANGAPTQGLVYETSTAESNVAIPANFVFFLGREGDNFFIELRRFGQTSTLFPYDINSFIGSSWVSSDYISAGQQTITGFLDPPFTADSTATNQTWRFATTITTPILSDLEASFSGRALTNVVMASLDRRGVTVAGDIDILGDAGDSVVFGNSSGNVATWAEGNNADLIPSSKYVDTQLTSSTILGVLNSASGNINANLLPDFSSTDAIDTYLATLTGTTVTFRGQTNTSLVSGIITFSQNVATERDFLSNVDAIRSFSSDNLFEAGHNRGYLLHKNNFSWGFYKVESELEVGTTNLSYITDDIAYTGDFQDGDIITIYQIDDEDDFLGFFNTSTLPAVNVPFPTDLGRDISNTNGRVVGAARNPTSAVGTLGTINIASEEGVFRGNERVRIRVFNEGDDVTTDTPIFDENKIVLATSSYSATGLGISPADFGGADDTHSFASIILSQTEYTAVIAAAVETGTARGTSTDTISYFVSGQIVIDRIERNYVNGLDSPDVLQYDTRLELSELQMNGGLYLPNVSPFNQGDDGHVYSNGGLLAVSGQETQGPLRLIGHDNGITPLDSFGSINTPLIFGDSNGLDVVTFQAITGGTSLNSPTLTITTRDRSSETGDNSGLLELNGLGLLSFNQMRALGGISFETTTDSNNLPIATPAANTLDDYEEGTWTPTGSVNDFTVTAATYTKVGDVVVLNGELTLGTTNSGGFFLSGIPFTPLSDSTGTFTIQASGSSTLASGTNVIPLVRSGLTNIAFLLGPGTFLQFSSVNGAQGLTFGITYKTNS